MLLKEVEHEKPLVGWICPRCKKVNAPDVKSCDCTTTEDTDKDNRQLLNE